MVRRIAISSLIACFIFVLGGCGNGPRSTTMQGVDVELPPSKEVVRDTHDHFETREFKVTITSSNLRINGASYGSVQKGDHVKVNADATVTVNGAERHST
jgi:hypothetical protein